jgi:hypothetical protein
MSRETLPPFFLFVALNLVLSICHSLQTLGRFEPCSTSLSFRMLFLLLSDKALDEFAAFLPVIVGSRSETTTIYHMYSTFTQQIYIRWCCIDLLRPPRLSVLRRTLGRDPKL